MKTVAIVQARMGSTRLPGKVLKDLAGEPVLVRVMNRLGRAKGLDEIVVATTTEPADDAIVELCAQRGWLCSRGSERDVLDRYYQAARSRQAGVIVRVTSDCPLIEPTVVDRVVAALANAQPGGDYAANVLPPRTFPRGLDTEAMRMDVLERAWKDSTDKPSREHVTYYIHQHPEQFRLVGVTNDRDLSDLRWTLDTPEDLELIRRIYSHFGGDDFAWTDVLSLLDRHPQWREINRHIEQKKLGETQS